ncbi:uncharacterized protein LOC124136817 [Haliotis rufescens]|uniref:uncharacterized protein LOC124136817 n=1 Tax=Haliotis rufescens TaxID=6454 RepID=UPI001EAFB4FC|nr:uncharacterized protein LOC124136817 [Haliotis rufescens]
MPGRMVPLGLTRICVPLLLCLMIAHVPSGLGQAVPPAVPLEVFTVDDETYISESLGELAITVGRPDDDTTTLTVTVAYTDGTARAPDDYSQTVTSINFGPTDTTQILKIPITDDRNVESTESFSIALSAGGYENKDVQGFITDDDSSVPFNCRRFGQDCVRGDCSPDQGLCSCPTGLGGDNCGYVTADVDGSGCSDKNCGSNGRCVSVTGAGFCICDLGYYNGDDDTCEIKRTTVTSCDNNKMTVCFNPIHTDSPLITVSGYISTECTAKLVSDITDTEDRIPSDIRGQCITVGFSGDCGTYTIEAKGDAEACFSFCIPLYYRGLETTG